MISDAPPRQLRSRTYFLGTLFLIAAGLQAAEPTRPTTGSSVEPPLADSALRIGGIFNASLPGTERRNALRLIFHPHFGDLLNRDFLRIPLGVRYGLTSRLEVSAETTAYFAHGISGNSFADEAGFSDIRLGTKLNLGRTMWDEWDTAFGVDYVRPVGSPPMDITDGLQHLGPYVTFSRHLKDLPSMRIFWSVGVDLVGSSKIVGELQENQLGDDANLFTTGFVWDRGRAHLTLEANYGTTRLIGSGDRDIFTLRPGVVWELPPKWAPGGRGRWLVGAGVRATAGPDGTDFGASMKIRVDANLKNWWKNKFRSKPEISP